MFSKVKFLVGERTSTIICLLASKTMLFFLNYSTTFTSKSRSQQLKQWMYENYTLYQRKSITIYLSTQSSLKKLSWIEVRSNTNYENLSINQIFFPIIISQESILLELVQYLLCILTQISVIGNNFMETTTSRASKVILETPGYSETMIYLSVDSDSRTCITCECLLVY